MLDEEMDDIIRNAAAKHHPAYNDTAWEKMEAQLDKHLPQKKDRRRFIFFLLFFLLLGGGALFSIIHFTENKTPVNNGVAENKGDKQLITENTVQNAVPVNDAKKPAGGKLTTEETGSPVNKVNKVNEVNNVPLESDNNIAGKVKKNNKPVTDQVDHNSSVQNNKATEKVKKNKNTATVNKGRSNIGIVTADLSADGMKDKNGKTKNNRSKTVNTAGKTNAVITAAVPENDENKDLATVVPADLKKEKNTADEQKKEVVKPNAELKEKDVVATKEKAPVSPDKKKSKKNVAANFGVTVSAGPDLSFIKLDKLGKATLSYGAGLSYNFAKRITVRTGFYFSKKIYTAEPDQYQAAPGVIYYDLNKIDATCRIYEIPVSLSYSFWQRKDHNWFGAVGLSSFLMKTEDYDYQYKSLYGQPYNYKKEIRNENKHYFSVLTLSAGYQYHLSKRVSLQAEPYVKLPLSGIGLGKIKLNSSGILLTLTVNPFAKRK